MRVLFVDIDTLRADHMSCYGYGRDTTPCMDSVAAEGTRFDEYYCPNAPCLPSRASLLSGRYGFHTGVVGHGGTAADMRLQGESRSFRDDFSIHNLFNLFRQKGLHTVSISTFAERHSAWWFNASLNEQYNVGKGGMEPAGEVTPVALDWIRRNAKRDNWFLHLHYWDPHTPYRTPSDYPNRYADVPLADNWVDQATLDAHIAHVGPHSASEIDMYSDRVNPKYPKHPGSVKTLAEYKNFIDQYDCGVRYTDDNVGMVLDALKEEGVYDDDLAVIITSDHGENLGELGLYGEHGTADYPTCRIPMILRWPGCLRGQVDRSLHTNVDLAPTVEVLLGVAPYDRWDGVSYADTLRTGATQRRESVVLTQCAHVCQRAARFGDWLYLRSYHTGYHLWEHELLFNVADDPHETKNLASAHPELCDHGARLLLDFEEDMFNTGDSVVDPLWTVMKEGGPFHARGHLREYCARLRATGRSAGAEELERRYPNEKYN